MQHDTSVSRGVVTKGRGMTCRKECDDQSRRQQPVRAAVAQPGHEGCRGDAAEGFTILKSITTIQGIREHTRSMKATRPSEGVVLGLSKTFSKTNDLCPGAILVWRAPARTLFASREIQKREVTR